MSDLAADVEQALAARRGRKVGAEIKFLCPSHDDQNPSAEWNRRKSAWNCPVCGSGGTTAHLAGLLGIHVESPAERAERGVIVATYDYRSAEGELLFQKVRYQPKNFALRKPDGAGGWKWGVGTWVLYRLPGLLTSTGRVYLCEGEKDADALTLLGLVATTWPEGAQGRKKVTDPKPQQKWKREYSAWLNGREVILLPDNDDAGELAMDWIAAQLAGTRKVLRLPGLPEKGDVSDWLAHGGTAAELEALADGCAEWQPQAEPQGIGAFALTDAGNAELFAHLYSAKVRYDHIRKRWLVWTRHRWQPDPDGEMYRLAVEATRRRYRESADIDNPDRATATAKFAKRSENSNAIESMLKLAQATEGLADAGLGWDANPYLLGTETGVVNLTTGELRPGKPDDRITMTTSLPYDRTAQCPRWLQFLAEVFGEDVIPFIKRAVGYSLTGSVREQVWFLCYGKGSNGKSVFMDIIYALGGDYSGDTPAETLTKHSRFGSGGQASPDVASLAGKRIITCSETEEVGGFNSARIKQLTGGNPVTARHLNQGFFTFTPALKLWLTTNHLPKVDDDSEGFWRRVRLIPFLRTFEGADRDPDLEEKLRQELAGILAWAVEGAVEWHRDGLTAPQSVMLATLNYRQSSDPLAEFISDCCYVGEGARATRGQLYEAYKAWAKGQGYGEREWLGVRYFARRIEERWPNRPSHGARYYFGVGVRTGGSGDVTGGSGDVTTSTVQNLMSKASEDMFSPREAESYVTHVTHVTRCDCEARHPRDEDCGDETWWSEGGEDGPWHCGAHHPQVISEGE